MLGRDLLWVVAVALHTLAPVAARSDPPDSFPAGSQHIVCKELDALLAVVAGAIGDGMSGAASAISRVPCVMGKMKAPFTVIESVELGEADLLGRGMSLWSVWIESTLSGRRVWLLWMDPVSVPKRESI